MRRFSVEFLFFHETLLLGSNQPSNVTGKYWHFIKEKPTGFKIDKCRWSEITYTSILRCIERIILNVATKLFEIRNDRIIVII